MKERRGWKLVRNNLFSLFLVIGLIVLAAVFAGDVIVKEGDVDINDDLNVSGILYVNSTSGNVGIGTSTPKTKLHVFQGTSNNNGQLQVGGTASIGTQLSYENIGSGRTALSDLNNDGGSNNRISIGFGTITSGVPVKIVTTFNQDGRVGIGTTTPSYLLEVDGTSDFGNTMTFGNGAVGTISWGTMGGGYGFGIQGESGRSLSFGANGVWDKMVINASTGRVGIGTTAPSQKLEVKQLSEGNVMRLDDGTEICDLDPDAGVLTQTCSSDESLKTNITDADSVLDTLMKLKIKQFNMKKSGEKNIGIIAQDLILTNPELVKDITFFDEEINTTEIIKGVQVPNSWELIKAIQELKQENILLKSELCKKDSSYEWC